MLTLGEAYRAIQGTVWMNHQWYQTIFHEGFRQLHDYRLPEALRSRYRDEAEQPFTLEEASGCPSPDLPSPGGHVPAEELRRLRDAGIAIVGSPKGQHNMYQTFEHLSADDVKRVSRLDSAEHTALLQNDFAAVGAGPNRFVLSWGS